MTQRNGSGETGGGLYGGRMKRLPYVLITPVVFILPIYATLTYLFSVPMGGPAASGVSIADAGLSLGLIAMAGILQFVLTSIPVVRRLNDAGRDRGLVALLMIPLANVGLLLYLAFAPSRLK